MKSNPEDLTIILRQPVETAELSKGRIEYAFYGEGPVLLCIHGGPGGVDQGLILGEAFQREGFRILSISRAGYLGSALSTGLSFEDQADSIAELLDRLGIEKVFLVHASAGGPTGYTFAKKYGGRVLAQVAIDSVSMKYTVKVSKFEEAVFMSKIGLRLVGFVTDHFPKMVIEELLKTESTLSKVEIKQQVKEILKDPCKVELIRLLTRTMGADRFAERKEGLANDLRLFAELVKLPLAGTSSPTLIFHGDSDKDVHPRHAGYAHENIKGSELCWIPKGSHLCFWVSEHSEEMLKKATGFLRKYLK